MNKKIYNIIRLCNAFESQVKKISSNQNDIIEHSGGDPIPAHYEYEETKLPISNLLNKDVAYLNDIFEIDNDPNHPDRDWSVYRNVKRIQHSINNLNDLPPIQIVRHNGKDKVVDGAHRLNALNLLSKENPLLLNEKIKVQIYDQQSYENALKELNKLM